jgi:hypothetical protein
MNNEMDGTSPNAEMDVTSPNAEIDVTSPNAEMDVTSPNAVGGGRMEPSATFGRGHLCCSSLLGPKPKPKPQPLPDVAIARPTSPSSAGRGEVSGFFWGLLSDGSAFRNALRCAVHRLVSVPSLLQSQWQWLRHRRSLLRLRTEELAIPVFQDTVDDEYHPRTCSRDIHHRFPRSTPTRSMQSQRRTGEQGVVGETFCCTVGLLVEHSTPRTRLLFGDGVTRELDELIPLSSVGAPCNDLSWGTKKQDFHQENYQPSDSPEQPALATTSPLPTQLGEVEWSLQRHSGGGLSGGRPIASFKPRPLPDVASARPTSPSFAGRGDASRGDSGYYFTVTSPVAATSPDAVGGGRMEPSATFGRGHLCCSDLLGPKPHPIPKPHPLPDVATARPTSPSFAGRGGRRRGGYVLVLVVLLLFGLMAMAALVIDIGFARLAQRQMQTATDAAALEGLRFRDVETDVARRERASTIVKYIFDDDPVLTSDARNFGAGPIVNFDDRVPGGDGFYANEFIHSDDNPSPNYPKIGSLPLVPVYKPRLNTNIGNAIEGDMVAGSSYYPNQVHTEDANYIRADFVPSSPGNPANDVFLVRMRRTGEISDDDTRTSGPPLQYLFGRGSLIPRRLIGDGIKVRATSIATAIPAVRVGPPVSNIPGILPIAIDVYNWNGNTANAVTITSNVSQGLSIGEAVTLGAPVVPVGSGFCAICQTTSPSNIDRVIGFGWIGLNAPAPKMSGNIASRNATGRRCDAWQTLGSLSDLDRDLIIDLNAALKYPLLAPVLVR